MALTNDQITANNFREFYLRIKPFLNFGSNFGFTPIGTVIAVMGKTAPEHYLECNGQIVNIVDYPDLAAYFEQQFDSSNYFGGDGVTTFAVPDLQGEFLRGSGTNSHTNQGNGADVGEHQDATEFPRYEISNSKIYGTGDTNKSISNADKYTAYGNTYGTVSMTNGTNTNQWFSCSGRPTNTSVLYCIATKNIYIGGSGSGGGGTSDYTDLENKPQINGNELVGDKTSAQLGLTDVSWTQSLSTGTKIAEIDINGTSTDVYAPSGGSGTGGHEIQENGTALPTEPALNFNDFDLDDNATDESTDVQPHRLTSAELDDIVTRPPAVYRGNEYSESEQVVGHWIDGNVIYEKTISCGALPNATIKQVPHGVADIDTVINMCGFASKTQESTELVDSIQLYYYCTDTDIVIKTYTDMTSWTDSYVTIRYTKVIGG